MQTVKIILFTDARPGHEKQSRGIVQALRSYVDVVLTEVSIRHRAALTMLGSHLGYFFHLAQPSESVIDPSTDLIVGTGRRTHIPMLSAGRKTHTRVITCMTPARHLLHRFDLCFIPYHDRTGTAENVFYTVGPPNVSIASTEHDPTRGLVLIGGVDKHSHIWHSEAVASDVKRLILGSEKISWTISSSPRTPAATEALIKKIMEEFGNVRFVPFRETESGWLERQYIINDSVWVTADSISMVYEALSAGCRVGVLPVAWKKKNNKFQRSLNYLLKERLIVSLDQYVQGNTMMLRREPLNEADRCAKEILRRWWPKNLP